jgi:hypothetical protein
MDFGLDELAVKAAFSQPDIDGTFRGALAEYMKIVSKRRPVLLFAFAPKSAGTFLSSAAIAACGGSQVRAVHAQGGREAQLYLPIFLYYYEGGVCEGPMGVHVHMLARPGNCRFIEALSLKPIVMVRPIPDMLASMCDMLSGEPEARLECIFGEVPEAFPTFACARQADFMIDMIAPWYVNYFATWFQYAAGNENVLVLRFADFLADPLAMLERTLAHAGAPQARMVCQTALEGVWQQRAQLRFNKGVAGRGKDYFSPDHCARLARMMDNYPILDGWRRELL